MDGVQISQACSTEGGARLFRSLSPLCFCFAWKHGNFCFAWKHGKRENREKKRLGFLLLPKERFFACEVRFLLRVGAVRTWRNL
jgi:hypothetical protein